MLVSREDGLPCPGSSMLLLGSLHSCCFSSRSVPCHLCGHTKALPCPWLRRRRGAMQSEFPIGVGPASLAWQSWGGHGCHGLCSHSLSVSVCAVLCCQRLLALLGFCLSLCSPGASGELEVSPASPSQGSLQGLPSPPSREPSSLPCVTPAIYSSR